MSHVAFYVSVRVLCVGHTDVHCLKNDSALDCYNFDEHRTILIIFDKNVAKKV